MQVKGDIKAGGSHSEEINWAATPEVKQKSFSSDTPYFDSFRQQEVPDWSPFSNLPNLFIMSTMQRYPTGGQPEPHTAASYPPE